MAVRICSSPSIIIPRKPHSTKKSVTTRVVMLAQRESHISLPLVQIRSSIKLHKVFEDKVNGIVCYRDDKGEITCEGYDEGPRPQPGFARLTYKQRDTEAIVDLLQRSLLQVIDVGKNCIDQQR